VCSGKSLSLLIRKTEGDTMQNSTLKHRNIFRWFCLVFVVLLYSCDTNSVPEGSKNTHGDKTQVLEKFVNAWKRKDYTNMQHFSFRSFWHKNSKQISSITIISTNKIQLKERIEQGKLTMFQANIIGRYQDTNGETYTMLSIQLKPVNDLWYVSGVEIPKLSKTQSQIGALIKENRELKSKVKKLESMMTIDRKAFEELRKTLNSYLLENKKLKESCKK
jgi:hypothetical protein